MLQDYVTKTSKTKQAGALPAAGAAILRAMTAPGSELVMVGLSAVPSEGHHVGVPGDIEVSFEGHLFRVPCRYVPLLLEDLVKPVAAEHVTRVAPLRVGAEVVRHSD